jgi:hypothetical protein
MSERVYNHNKEQVFRDCGLITHKKGYNCHHIVERFDLKRHLIHPHFPVDHRSNLIPLPMETHEELHELMDNTPCFSRNINTRIYLANMAFIGELDLVPERLYLKDPMDIMRK